MSGEEWQVSLPLIVAVSCDRSMSWVFHLLRLGCDGLLTANSSCHRGPVYIKKSTCESVEVWGSWLVSLALLVPNISTFLSLRAPNFPGPCVLKGGGGLEKHTRKGAFFYQVWVNTKSWCDCLKNFILMGLIRLCFKYSFLNACDMKETTICCQADALYRIINSDPDLENVRTSLKWSPGFHLLVVVYLWYCTITTKQTHKLKSK